MSRPRLRRIKGFRIPLVDTLRTYQRAWLRHDVVAGLTVCVVMIPSVIAYAELVHLPPIAGLYAAFAGAIGYAVFASSRHVIAGPDAAIGLLAGMAILPLSGGDLARTVVLAIELSLLSGLVLLMAARLNLGAIADLLSRPVLIGYLNGASLVLVSTQLGKLVGLRLEGEGFFLLIHALLSDLGRVHLPTLAFGLVLIGLLIWVGRAFPRVPGALAASALAIGVAWVADVGHWGVALVGPVPAGVPLPACGHGATGRHHRAGPGGSGHCVPHVFGRHLAVANLCRQTPLRD